MDVGADPGVRLEFHRDPSRFMAVAGAYLGAEPVVNTVVATVTARIVARRADGASGSDRDWWLVVRGGSGAIAGAGMRTVGFPPFLLPMPDGAALSLARALYERDEDVPGVNGALPAARVFADESARLAGGTVTVVQHNRLHELTEPVPPAPVPGQLVTGTEDDLDLVEEWCAAFSGDADEQAGRERGSGTDESLDRAELLGRIRDGGFWFWVNGAGERVHLTAANPPAYGVVRIGPVYTPPAERGRGWASNAVAEVSRRILAAGSRACLYTDQANPTSNKVYAAIGYRPVVDMANLAIAR